MKSWICNNLLGEDPNHVDVCGMLSGLGILCFLVLFAYYLFVYIPFFTLGAK